MSAYDSELEVDADGQTEQIRKDPKDGSLASYEYVKKFRLATTGSVLA